jgi:myo-inositol-1(or 4)-monophosphatase
VSPRSESRPDDGGHDKGRWPAAPAELRGLLQLATELAAQAGRVHAAGARGALRIETKSSSTDMVSQVDREAERLIVDGLRRARPNDGILAEEGSAREGTSDVRWVIDPLDGTTNFVYGYAAYGVSVAVEVNRVGQVGVVLDSANGLSYEAIAGHGAWCGEQRLSVRAQTDLSHALLATGFSYDADERRRAGVALGSILGSVRDIRRSGSAALDLCHLAAGHVDAYYEVGLAPWDHAAGAVIAREAGADVRHVAGAFAHGDVIVAANPLLMPSLLTLLAEAGVIAQP